MPMCFINDHHSLNPHPLFIYWGLRFLKNHRKGASWLPCTNGWMLLLIKSIILFCSPLNMKKNLFLMGLILCLSCISLGQYCLENVAKSGEIGKKDIQAESPYRALIYRREVQIFCTLWFIKLPKYLHAD